MAKKDYELINRPCRVCNKILTTTSRREVVHAECRKEYYQRSRANPSGLKRLIIAKNRSRVHISEQPCVVCGYMLITKVRTYFNLATQKNEEYHLCLRCLGEIRCGFMEPVTWKRNESAGL